MRIIFLVSFLLFSAFLFSQEHETIQSDRPGQANSPFSVGSGIFQLQTGLSYGGAENSSINYESSSFNGNTFLRYGITEKVDITTSGTYLNEKSRIHRKADQRAEDGIINVGTRVSIYQGKGRVPALGMQVSLEFPSFNSNAKQYLAPDFQLIASNSLIGQLSYNVNVGIDYDGFTPIPTGFYVVNLAYSLGQKSSIFFENYGNQRDTDFNTFWDFGFAFLPTNNLQWDIFAGFSENEGLESYFISAGLSWRILKKENQSH